MTQNGYTVPILKGTKPPEQATNCCYNTEDETASCVATAVETSDLAIQHSMVNDNVGSLRYTTFISQILRSKTVSCTSRSISNSSFKSIIYLLHKIKIREYKIPYQMQLYNSRHFTLALTLWSLAIGSSSTSQESSQLDPVVAPRLFSVAYLHGPGTYSPWNLGHSRQLETQMMSFLWERHSKNHLDGRSDSVDVFYNTIEGTDMIDALAARLTDEDILQFRESFLVSYKLSALTCDAKNILGYMDICISLRRV